MMLEERSLSSHGHTVHTVVGGDGPPLLFLHGWPTHSGLYRKIMPEVGAYRRTIAIDLPGFGASSKPTDVRYDFPFFQRIIDDVLAELEVDRVGLVVHDLGGPVGLRWAVENRERVRELAVLNTLVFPELHWAVKVFIASVSLPGLAQAMSSPWGIRASIRLGMKTPAGRDVLDLYAEPFKPRSGRKALAMAGRQLSLRKLARMAEGLSKLQVPSLLLYGTADAILPDVAQTMERLNTLWPHAERVALPGVGHFLQEDAPESVAEHLTRFLAGNG